MNITGRFWEFETIVFDLDGTLVDTLPDLTSSLNLALRETGLAAVSKELVRASLSGGLEESAAQAIRHLGADSRLLNPLVDAYRRHYSLALALESAPYPGVRAVLSKLQAHETKLAVCTNKQQSQAVAILQTLELLPFFEIVVGADTCDYRKPHPAPLLFALDQMRSFRFLSLMVGDSPVDTTCAQAAGVDCLFFEGGYGQLSDDAPRPTCRLLSFEALLTGSPAHDRASEPVALA